MIFRVSFSILNSWAKGYHQDAIDMYFKVEREPNIYMIEGTKFHDSWQKYIEKNKKLHPQLSTTNKKLDDPKCELKLVMPINEEIELVGKLDCLDNVILYEFKSGSKPSSEYANGKQIDIYSLLAEYHGYFPKIGMYIHFDQYLKETDSAMVWLTPKRREEAKEWIIEQATSMRDYLLANNYFEKYKPVEIVDVDLDVEP